MLSGLVLAFVLLELLFRVLPTSDTLIVQPVNEKQPIFHFLENREVHLSRGSLFSITSRKRVNNYGFLSDIDYDGRSTAPKIAVIGDSYVAAVQVSNADSVSGVMSRKLGHDVDVYSLGSSGSALSQYIAYTKFAKREFAPSLFVFVIIANDFDESALEYAQFSGLHYFSLVNGSCELVRLDYAPSHLRNVLRHSALLRYLYVNVGVEGIRSTFQRNNEENYVSNVRRNVDAKRMRKAMRSAECFISHLSQELEGTPAILVFDGPRSLIYKSVERGVDYKNAYDRSFPGRMYKDLRRIAAQSGITVLDLEPVFLGHFRVHRKRFEFPTDNHWNELGHAVAAGAVLDSSAVQRITKASGMTK